MIAVLRPVFNKITAGIPSLNIFKASILLGLAASLSFAAPAYAQFSDSYNFLKAVKERDGKKATDFINEPGSTLINTRDYTTGEGALHIVVARRDMTWLGFLLQRGANPNVRSKKGMTPLMLATQLRFTDGVELLLRRKAKVDETNRQGETALIKAVQFRDLPTVRILLSKGADPDKTDTLAGLSARDYATRDRRAATILLEIQKTDKKPKEQKLDFSGPKLDL